MAVGDNKFADIVERRLRVMSSFVNCQSRDCSETALKLLRNCSGTAPKLLRNCSESAPKLLRNCSETVMKLLRGGLGLIYDDNEYDGYVELITITLLIYYLLY